MVKTIFLVFSCAIFSFATYSMNEPQKKKFVAEKKLIEINGVRQDMLGHVLAAQKNPENDLFSVTSIVRYDGSKFIVKGDVLSADLKDLEEIAEDNFVYTPYYALLRTKFSDKCYESVGAIIVGSTDESLVLTLQLEQLKQLVKNRQ